MPTRFPHAFALATAALLLGFAPALAETHPQIDVDGRPNTFSGNYLAGRSADRAKDISAAAGFYRDALAEDPGNIGLMERVTLLGIASGDMEGSFVIAEQLLDFDPSNPVASVALAVRAVKTGDEAKAQELLARIARADLSSLTAGIMIAWMQAGQGQVDEAMATIGKLRGPDWYQVFRSYHSALIYDSLGRHGDAVKAISEAYTEDASALRIVEGYARIMARAGKPDVAIDALERFSHAHPGSPFVNELLAQIKSGKMPDAVAAGTREGIGELLYGLGSAIGLDEGPELSAAYLRMAAYLQPDEQLITLAIGDAFQGSERCEDAIAIYDSVPATSPLRRNADFAIGTCYQILERYDEAIGYFVRLVDADPKDADAAMQLGNAYRADNRFIEAADAYTQALAADPEAADADWRVYYFRGVSLERSKRWPEAERDFRKALAINPEQPQVLNYLGYSWVDQGLNLDEGLDFIKQAVEARPNDGYIIDSLGWAYYRLGRFDEAVTALENAVQLRAEDPVINDHLGDAYWRVGRKREAMFQWAHARDLDPEPDELPLILQKLQHGLDAVTKTDAITVDPANSIRVEKGESLWDIALRVYGDAGQYQRILDANKDRITDPNRIFPGMELVVPAPTAN